MLGTSGEKPKTTVTAAGLSLDCFRDWGYRSQSIKLSNRVSGVALQGVKELWRTGGNR